MPSIRFVWLIEIGNHEIGFLELGFKILEKSD